MAKTAYRWMVTPAELFECFQHVQVPPTVVSLERTHFGTPKLPLEGTPYTYQLALSNKSLAVEIVAIREECPKLPRSADKRSGVLIFEGDKIIGSYVIPGNYTREAHRIVVHKDYRGKGLGVRMVEQWYRETVFAMDIGKQPLNAVAVRTFLSAHRAVIRWAERTGKTVPAEVKYAVSRGAEAAKAVAEADLVARQPLPSRLAR